MSEGEVSVAAPSAVPASPTVSSPLMASSHLDDLLDSSASVAAFVARCRAEVGHHARATLAAKLALLSDSNLRASFIDHGGLAVLISWLNTADCPSAVIKHALDALATLPLTQAQLAAHPLLIERLDALRTHSDEAISQLADDTHASYTRKLQSSSSAAEMEEDDAEMDGDLAQSSGSKFHLIKIDKASTDMHDHQLAIYAEEKVTVTPLVFESTAETPTASTDSVLASEENKQKQLNDKIEAIKIDSDTAADTSASPVQAEAEIAAESSTDSASAVLSTSKKPRRSVTWVEDDSIEQVKLFFKDEPIIKVPISKAPAEASKERRASAASTVPLKPSIEWKTPVKIELSPALHAIHQARGKESKERDVQAEREKKTLRTFYQPHEIPPNPSEAMQPLSSEPVTMQHIPFNPVSQSPAAIKSENLLAQLSSLASMIGVKNSPSASASTSTAPSVSSSLASLSSLINGYKPPVPSPKTVPQYSPAASSAPYTVPSHLTAAPAATAAPSGGASKLLSLLAGSGSSALGNIAAALSKSAAPTQPPPAAAATRWGQPPPAAQPPAVPPPSQQSYTAPPPQYGSLPPQQQPAYQPITPATYAPQQPPPASHAPQYYPPSQHQPPPAAQPYAPPAPYSHSAYYGAQSAPAYQQPPPPAHYQQPPPAGGYGYQQPPPAQPPHSGFTSYHVPPPAHHPPPQQHYQPPPSQASHHSYGQQSAPAQHGTQTGWTHSTYQSSYAQPPHATQTPHYHPPHGGAPPPPVYDPDALNRNKRKRDLATDDGHAARLPPAVRH